MTKKVLLGLPPALLMRVDFAAKIECRTRSDLLREAIRRYLDNFERGRLIEGKNTVQSLENSLDLPAADQHPRKPSETLLGENK